MWEVVRTVKQVSLVSGALDRELLVRVIMGASFRASFVLFGMLHYNKFSILPQFLPRLQLNGLAREINYQMMIICFCQNNNTSK